MFNPKDGENQSWTGAALYLNYALSDAAGLGIRTEYISDKDGIITGVADDQILSLTASANISIGNLTIIPEIRSDLSNKEQTYTNGDGKSVKSLSGFILAAVYKF